MSDNLPIPKDPATTAIEKGIEEAAATARHYLDTLLGDSLGQAGRLIADTVGFWRFKNQVRIILKAKAFLESKGIDPKAVLPKVALPILEAGSLENDEEMHGRWTMLLANAAASPDSISPAFPKILAELSPLDAKILQYAYEQVLQTGRHPTHVHWRDALQAVGVTFPADYPVSDTGVLASDDPALGTTIHNLIRLELITTQLTQYYLLNRQIINKETFELTPFGFIFIRACNPPE